MSANGFFTPLRPSSTSLDNFWIPLVAAGALLLADIYLIPGVFTLPLMLLMLLIFLSFRLKARVVAIWAVIYAALILSILLMPIEEAVTASAIRPYIRTAGFLVGASATVLVASHRRRLEKGHEAVFHILSALPLPVIVSDISGNILLMNDAAQVVLRDQVNSLNGLSYFSTFVNPDDQGQAIAKYISNFDPSHVGPISTTLRTRGTSPLTLKSFITVVDVGTGRYAITMLERMDETAGVPEVARPA